MAHTERKCAYCAYLNKNLLSVTKGKFVCERDHTLHFADQDAPGRCFTEIFWRDIDLAKEAMEESRRYKGWGCYIVTSIIEILSEYMIEKGEVEKLKQLNDNLRTFQSFRGNILAINSNYRSILMKYDVIAPLIALKLKEMPNRVEFAKSLYVSYLLPCLKAINKGEVDNAIDIYSSMMNGLIDIFPVTYVIGDIAKENYHPLVEPDMSPFDGKSI